MVWLAFNNVCQTHDIFGVGQNYGTATTIAIAKYSIVKS
jgi:hypothetical protein